MEPFSWTFKLEPTTTSYPRRRDRGLHNPDSSYDQIQCFWLAEVRSFTNIMIEYAFYHDKAVRSLGIPISDKSPIAVTSSLKSRALWERNPRVIMQIR